MKSYFMDELHSIRAEIVNCKNKTKDPTFVDVKVSELQDKIGILEAEYKLLKESCSNLFEVVRDIFRSHTVKVRPNTGASIHDLMDYVKPAMRKKPKALVIHTCTNDIQQEINTMKMVKKLVKVIKEIDSEKETEIIFSGLIQREDHDFRDQIEEINVKLKGYCESKGYRFVENSNIDGGFLNRSKLHPTKRVWLCLVEHCQCSQYI